MLLYIFKMESKVITENIYELDKIDTASMKSLINKTVEIHTVNGKKYVGVVYVVDPVSKSIVLISPYGEKCNVDVIFSHAIESLSVSTTALENKTIQFSTNNLTKTPDQKLNNKRINVISWFKKNLIDVNEDGLNLKVGDDLVIEPPYDEEHCFSSNTIILQRIQEILSKMPDLN